MADAVSNAMAGLTPATNQPGPTVDEPRVDSYFGGAEMLQELKDNRFGRGGTTDSGRQDGGSGGGSSPASHNSEVDSLKSEVQRLNDQIAKMTSGIGDIKGLEGRLNGVQSLFQSFVQGQQQQRQQGPDQSVQAPQFQLGDPDLEAAFNTLLGHIDKKFEVTEKSRSQQETEYRKAQEWQRFNHAANRLLSDSEFAQYFNPQEMQQFAAQYINGDPKYAATIDWEKEFKMGLNVRSAPTKETRIKELEAEVAKLKSGKESQREKQRSQLHLVTGVGQRSGSSNATGGATVGDQILRDAKSRGKKMSFKQFGAELLRRRGAV